MTTLYIYTEQQQATPVDVLQSRSPSARAALKRYGFSDRQINRVLPDLDCFREVMIDTFTIQRRV